MISPVPEQDDLKAPQPPPAHITTVAPEKRWVLLAQINRHLRGECFDGGEDDRRKGEASERVKESGVKGKP
ncbi:hypothetical protein F2Q69_00018593 [Brassica cretica]|uniref:Uncharacterized protein n=1 Tax=Brassica cretica TaxID=69181 RepID=A0A8S9QR67_BRACR|nr:hypothetical protein F2Q69_00018593 [Brassica cretica]